jgi:hypothetical protein
MTDGMIWLERKEERRREFEAAKCLQMVACTACSGSGRIGERHA